jgi:hypothetical protein
MKEKIKKVLDKHSPKFKELFTILEKESIGCLFVFEVTDANKYKHQDFDVVTIDNINDFERHKAIRSLINVATIK